ncbi:MAG: TonB-dependent receptor [Robiginitomaculum sp.]|nr:TonB-dependent receptor [Robiginitomaculum sp.]MDQ7076386.1 TonB-dependent receptor [Robiginitomaculum sp.]
MKHSIKIAMLCAASSVALGSAGAASAQSAGSILEDEIIVTATKKAGGVNIQEAPVAITAFGEKQLEVLHVTDLHTLSYSIPNVSLDDIGTSRGVANFSIRGLGINSSIPSIDPTVGVFVDGMYLGINGGVVLDIFDLESIEVLRGPQGILFGRNVTGGAVLINTKKPTDEFKASFKSAAESGFKNTGGNYYLMGSVSGPIVQDKLKAKVAAYYNKDNGYFKNYLGGPRFGKPDAFSVFGQAETVLVRPSLVYTPNDNLEFTLRYEHGDSNGDGPAAQNHPGRNGTFPNVFVSFDRNSDGFSIDEVGFYNNNWDQVIFETNWNVPFGDGVITNIAGFRDFVNEGRSDIDATPLPLFHASFATDQQQWSNELRYAGRFADKLDITTGLYFFTQDIAYQETRNIAFGRLNFFGGGKQRQKTYGAFIQGDYDLTDQVSFILGGRYTHETKRASIATLIFNRTPCDVITGTCPFDFNDRDSWTNFSPKVGLTWEPNDDWNVYGHWTQGFRSGGYNFRNTSAVFLPKPFNEEKVSSFEVGFKGKPNAITRINSAIFYNDISNMQREINIADPLAGVVQFIRNTADATIWGFESEAQVNIMDMITLLGSIGYTNGSYDKVLFDLNGDGALNVADKNLKIPRLAPWTYSVGFILNSEIPGLGEWSLRTNYSHRDHSFYTDNNLGELNGADILDLNLSFTTDNDITVSLYGKNLLNEVTQGGDTQLPATLGGGSFSPLNKGRIIGVELKFDIQ